MTEPFPPRMTRGGARIRLADAGDRAALYRICLRTGDAGEDATPLFRDTALLGHLYVGPYAALEPEHALVLEDAEGVCGYVVGALDTGDFNARVRAQWLPGLAARYPDPAGDPAGWSPDQRAMRVLHHPETAFPLALRSELTPYPSHLHIDLLPRTQGRGLGRTLLETLLDRLRRDGSAGVHLGVDERNRRAAAFYRHLGFASLRGMPGDHALWFGKRLG